MPGMLIDSAMPNRRKNIRVDVLNLLSRSLPSEKTMMYQPRLIYTNQPTI